MEQTSPSSFHYKSTFFMVVLMTLIGMVGIMSRIPSQVPPVRPIIEEPEGPEVNKTGRYVSMCPGNFDDRRLGNQLFNFAAMLHVARLTGRRVAMPRRHPYGWLDRWFDVRITRVDDIQKELCPCATIGEGRGLAYEPSMAILANRTDLAGKSLLVCGWFQSWKYTVGVEDVLRQHLRLLPNVSSAVKQFLDEIRPSVWGNQHFIRVGIHVRAGDIMTPGKLHYGYTIPHIHYFRQAMKLFVSSRVQFIVTSDSLDWVKSYLNLTTLFSNHTSVSIVFSNDHDAGFDLALLSLCDSVIMTTGTYGWWGGWLANKTTVYFSNWPRKGSALNRLFNRNDYFPQRWIAIDGPAT